MPPLPAWRAIISRTRAICARPEGLIRFSDRFSPSITSSPTWRFMRPRPCPPLQGTRWPSTRSFGTWPSQASSEGERPSQASREVPYQVSSTGKSPAQEPEPVPEQVLQPNKGVIFPLYGSYRATLSPGKELGLRLPVVTQTSFVSHGDIPLVNWESLPEYLSRVKIALPVVNPLITESQLDSDRNHMLSARCKVLWSSVMDLVIANKARGYCIAKSLTPENLLVSTLYGTVAIKHVIAENIPKDQPGSQFQGFKALAYLFVQMVQHVHGTGMLGKLTIDVDHWLSVLVNPFENDGTIANYHPAMMSVQERQWLSVKLHMVLRNYVRTCRSLAPKVGPSDFISFGYTIEELDSMHGFFSEWRRFSTEFSEKMKAAENQSQQKHSEDPNSQLQTPEDTSTQPQTPEDTSAQSQTPEDTSTQAPLAPEDLTKAFIRGGMWVTALFRNSVMHSHSYELSKICGFKRYTPAHVVQLTHYKVSMYLPNAVAHWKSHLRHYFDIDSCRTRPPLYPQLPIPRPPRS